MIMLEKKQENPKMMNGKEWDLVYKWKDWESKDNLSITTSWNKVYIENILVGGVM